MSPHIIHLDIDDFEKISSCPLCSGTNFKYIGNLKNRIFINRRLIQIDVENFNLRRCKDCGLVYRNYVTLPETERKMQSFWLNDSGKFSHWHTRRLAGHYKIKKLIDELSRKVFSRDQLNLLDIGIGEGDFIKIFNKDYKTYGLEEYDIDSLDYSSLVNSDMIYGNLQNAFGLGYSENFEIITALDIFEHLRLPEVAIENIYSMLTKGGLLFIETGNIDCFIARTLKQNKWWYTEILEHKIFWTPTTLSKAIEKKGFKVLKVIKKLHKSRMILDQKPVIKFLLYKISPKLYVKLMRSINKDYLSEPQLRIPWRDHFFIIAQKPEC